MGSKTTAAVPKPQLEGCLTVMPIGITDPRRTRHVSAPGSEGDNLMHSAILKGCLNVVLFYERSAPAREDSGWIAAGWMKESLARALSEEPLLGGRLRRGEVVEENGGDGGGPMVVEVVSNDSGARLLEATIPVSVKELMEMEEKVRADAEADLVFWKEIDCETPQFSPLFYVQVTNFKCGGYSVGISCSLILADLLITHNFLHKWAQIQQKIAPELSGPKQQLPIFYLPNLKPNGSFPPEVFSSTPSRGQSHTSILKSTTQNDDDVGELIASLYAKGTKIPNKFRMIEVKESLAAVVEVKTWRKAEVGGMKKKNGDDGWWEEVKMEEVCFYQGKKPDGLACWVGWPNEEDGFLMAIDGGIDGGVVAVVAIPGCGGGGM